MKKMIIFTLLTLIILTTLAVANPTCHRCKYNMTEVKTTVGQLYICRNCAKDVIVKVEVEDKKERKQ